MTRFVLTSGVCALLLVPSQAFVSSPSFVTPRHTLSSTFGVSSSTTSLQMNLFDRFTRVAKANINNVLKNLEDPEKIMNQAVEDMQVSSIVCEKQNDRE